MMLNTQKERKRAKYFHLACHAILCYDLGEWVHRLQGKAKSFSFCREGVGNHSNLCASLQSKPMAWPADSRRFAELT